MEDKIKKLIESAMKSGADVKVVKINSNKSESVEKLIELLEENVEPELLISFELEICPSYFKGSINLNNSMVKYVEKTTTLTKEDIIKAFEPARNAFENCTNEFEKLLVENQKEASSEDIQQIQKIMDVMLGADKNVN